MHSMEIRWQGHNYSEQSESKQCLGLPTTLKANYVEHTDFSHHTNQRTDNIHCLQNMSSDIACGRYAVCVTTTASSDAPENHHYGIVLLPTPIEAIKFHQGPKMKEFT